MTHTPAGLGAAALGIESVGRTRTTYGLLPVSKTVDVLPGRSLDQLIFVSGISSPCGGCDHSKKCLIIMSIHNLACQCITGCAKLQIG